MSNTTECCNAEVIYQSDWVENYCTAQYYTCAQCWEHVNEDGTSIQLKQEQASHE